ncbi:MAG TPA: hypothetical protein VL307_08445 [Chitinophagaceae bacterium]|nr:hypothetical protein [Chitinophagaceae bacterium]
MNKIFTACLLGLLISLAAAAQDSTGKELIGKYKFPPGSVIEEAVVTFENGVISMSSSAGVSVLEKTKGDTFNIVSFNGIAVFKRDEARKIAGVHIDASGYVLEGEKEAARLAMLRLTDAIVTDKIYAVVNKQLYR